MDSIATRLAANHWEHPPVRRVFESGKPEVIEAQLETLKGRRDFEIRHIPERGEQGEISAVLGIAHDITETKQADKRNREHLHFLQSLDRFNQLLHEEGDIEQIMNRALKEVLDIFDGDRAYLAYPGDPDAETWSVHMESTRPEYPGILQQEPQPMNDSMSSLVQALLELNHPVAIGPGGQYSVPAETTEKFNVQSDLVMILRPMVDKPWLFGIQQCSHVRIWSDQEKRLFEEISHRLSDGLNNLLIRRNLRESEARFRLVFESTPVSIQEEDYSAVKRYLESLRPEFGDDLEAYLEQHPEVLDKCAALVRVIDINRASLALHEADNKDAILLRGLPETFIPETQAAYRDVLASLMGGETNFRKETEMLTLSGRRQHVDVFISVCPGYEKSLGKVLVSLIDITQRKQDEDSLRLAASVFSTSQEGILISDTHNRIIDINPAFTELTGYTREEALGKNPSFLSAGRQDKRFYAEMWQSINATGEWQGELWNMRKSGEVYPEWLSIIAVKDEQGQLQRYVGAFSDISIIKQHEADLERIAHYDMLTSIPNRRLLGNQLEKAIAHSRRNGKNLAVCYLDLDGFKPINDEFGHEGGDRMLVEIARRLEAMSRGEDTVARLGGDEFVLLWSDIGSKGDCVKALERILNKVAEPMLLEGQLVSVSASIGVTLYPDDSVDADSLLRHADHAMYTAKQLGKNRYQIFDARLERQISAQVELMEKIGSGLERGQFELYYQPKVDYRTGKAVGAEALLRWNDPVLGLVGPKEFISLIENDSMAFRMGRWVMEQAVRQARIWHEQGIRLPISINVFPRHLKHSTFVDDLRSAIASNWPQMPGDLLMIEIVETNDLEELEPIEQVIRQCLAMDISFSLDDFGTGYSSLVYLRRLSIQELKIDQSFVRDMLDDPEDEAIVVSVIRLGQAFGLQVVAEGVETVEQAQHLVDLGCHIVQGYGLGRPMPAHTLEKWYADYSALGVKECNK
ncbi:MAG: EAL domain-containing protein [Candidatus Thiodiazotropha sp.]